MKIVIGLIILTFNACIYTKYLLVQIPKTHREISNTENQLNHFVRHNKKESASTTFQSSKRLRSNGSSITSKSSIESPGFCKKCENVKENKEYFQIQCANFDKYFKCQSQCVKSDAMSPFECNHNSGCVKKCESRCKKLWPAAISYDAYCSMMDYIQESAIWNPYENEQQLVKWIATYYSTQKDEGKTRKNCLNNLPQNRISSRARLPASVFMKLKEDRFDNDVPTWDISFEEMQEAYKTTAMKRHLKWDTDKIEEENFCLPLHKIINERGNFPRRITWLYVDDGCEQRAQLFSKYLIKYLKKKFPVKSFGLPKKHFIFGNLEYATENAQYWNVVNWGFHVVPIIKLSGCDDLFILDPSIRPTPVTKSEYHNIFSGQISGYVTCHSNTYSITDDCNNPVKVTKNNMKEERLLDIEWDLQEQLGRNPEIVLGDKYLEENHYVFKEGLNEPFSCDLPIDN